MHEQRPNPGQALLDAGILPIAPGSYLSEHVLPSLGMSPEAAADAMHLDQKALAAVLTGQGEIGPDMAARLEEITGTTAEFWLNMQAAWSLAVRTHSIEDLGRLDSPGFGSPTSLANGAGAAVGRAGTAEGY